MNKEIVTGLIIGGLIASLTYVYNSNKFTKTQKTYLFGTFLFPPLHWLLLLITEIYNKYAKMYEKLNPTESSYKKLFELKQKGLFSEAEFKEKTEKLINEENLKRFENSKEYNQLKDLRYKNIITQEEFIKKSEIILNTFQNNQPKNNQPKNNQPKNNQPKNNQPKNNQPKNNQPKNNQPKNNFNYLKLFSKDLLIYFSCFTTIIIFTFIYNNNSKNIDKPSPVELETIAVEESDLINEPIIVEESDLINEPIIVEESDLINEPISEQYTKDHTNSTKNNTTIYSETTKRKIETSRFETNSFYADLPIKMKESKNTNNFIQFISVDPYENITFIKLDYVDLKDQYEYSIKDLKKTSEITYSRLKDNFFIIKGYFRGNLFYIKCIKTKDGLWKGAFATDNPNTEINEKTIDAFFHGFKAK